VIAAILFSPILEPAICKITRALFAATDTIKSKKLASILVNMV
jgi:Na+-transporting NADH:ubiquinone oxidoreductase subunit NqrB